MPSGSKSKLAAIRKRIRNLQRIEEMYRRDHGQQGTKTLGSGWLSESMRLGRPAPRLDEPSAPVAPGADQQETT